MCLEDRLLLSKVQSLSIDLKIKANILPARLQAHWPLLQELYDCRLIHFSLQVKSAQPTTTNPDAVSSQKEEDDIARG